MHNKTWFILSTWHEERVEELQVEFTTSALPAVAKNHVLEGELITADEARVAKASEEMILRQSLLETCITLTHNMRHMCH